LEVKSAELEAYRANLHRRKAEVKIQQLTGFEAINNQN
jgi:hypothetical protein